MTDLQVTRIVIEFFTDSEEEHNDKAERIVDFADGVMCEGESCVLNCNLVGLTTSRLTLEQFDRELEE